MSGTQLLATPGAAFILDVLIKSALLLLAAGLAALCLRRAAAATRHLIWLCALVALLLLPVLARIVPGIPVSGWSWMVPAIQTEASAPPLSAEITEAAQQQAQAPAPPSPPPLGLQRPLSTTVAPPTGILLGVYGGGIVLALWQVILGMACVRRFERDSIAPEDGSPLVAPCEEAAAAMGVRAPIRLLLSDTAPVPMTWGWHRPTILLPTAAMEWERERVRVALLHEMAHIARGDWAAQMLSHVVCALYWFHPLAWLAASRLRAESERAADDRVLLAGVPAADYARHLLEIAQSLRATVTSGATAMATKSHIEDRIRPILAEEMRRLPHRVTLPIVMTFGALIAGLISVRAEESSLRPTLSASVADGITVDVLAIGKEDASRWWNSQGRPLKTETLKSYPGALSDITHRKMPHDRAYEYRRVLLRVRHAKSEMPLINFVNAPASTTLATVTEGQGINEYMAVMIKVAKMAQTVRISLRVASGPWQERGVWQRGNSARRDYPTKLDFPARSFPEPVVFFAPRSAISLQTHKPKPGTEFWVQDHFVTEDHRATIQDGAGLERHTSVTSCSTMSGGKGQRLSCFTTEAIKPQGIAVVSFQTRPFRAFTLPALPITPSATKYGR